MILSFSEMSTSQRYFAMTQVIIPRPIAWVLTQNSNNTMNLAPYSFFTGVCSDPPILMISVGKKTNEGEEGTLKDTGSNILRSKMAVVHIASTEQLLGVNDSSASLLYGDSELDHCDLNTCAFDGMPLPRIQSSPVALFCKLHKMDEIGNAPQSVFYLEIETLFVDDSLLIENGGKRFLIDAQKLNPLARLGGSFYSSLGDILSARRPK